MSGHGIRVRIDNKADCPPPTVHILSDHPERVCDGQTEFRAPNGTLFKVFPKSQPLVTPPTRHGLEVRRLGGDDEPWVVGRAGMLYRDLIPDRLGGSIIASQIKIPKGGPVPDTVHYHTIGFQLIYCINGWVKVVYEDQGDPFILEVGDCVTQPPEIRHRVLESSDNLEVIEICVPAEHMTTIDHEMKLPTKWLRPEREFRGQRFCHHVSKNGTWSPWRMDGFVHMDTKVNEATKGIASVHVARVENAKVEQRPISHDSDVLFTFILKGKMELTTNGNDTKSLNRRDAYVIPPNLKYQLSNFSDDLELLEVALPGNYKTTYH